MSESFGSVFINSERRLRNGWKVGLFMLALSAAGILVALGLRLFHIGRLPAWFPGELLSGVLTLLVSWLFLRLEGRSFASVGFSLNRSWLVQFAAGTGLGIALIVITALGILGAGGFHWVRNPAGSVSTLLAGAWLFLAVGINEEGLFRGYLFQRLVDGIGVWPTQLLMAVLFAMVHWGNPGMSGAVKIWATLNIALSAILLGLAYLKTRSLALPIGIHLGWNWAQGNLLGFQVSGTAVEGFWKPSLHAKPAWLHGGAFGLEATLACTIICTAFILGLAGWKHSALARRSTEA